MDVGNEVTKLLLSTSFKGDAGRTGAGSGVKSTDTTGTFNLDYTELLQRAGGNRNDAISEAFTVTKHADDINIDISLNHTDDNVTNNFDIDLHRYHVITPR